MRIIKMLRISQKSNAGFDLACCFMKFGRFHSHIGSEQLAEAIDLSRCSNP
jgi:hypothetical protein